MANLDPRVIIGRNYKGAYKTLLHTKYKRSGPHGFREEDFFHVFSFYKSMEANDPLGRGQHGPQGHDWQDLRRVPLNVATYSIYRL